MDALARWAHAWAAAQGVPAELVLTRGDGAHLAAIGEAFPRALVVSLTGRDERPRPHCLLCATPERFQRVAVKGMALGLETFRANPPDELAGPGGKAFDELLAGARLEAVVERATLGELGPLFLDNLRANVRRFLDASFPADVRPMVRGRAALVLGSGTSLEDALPLLPSLRERSVVFAGTSALRTLHRAGVRPDVAVVIEPRACLHHVEGIPEEWLSGIALLADAVTHPAHLALPWRRVIPFAGPVAGWLAPAVGQGNGVPTGGNVGTAMLVLAWTLGAYPVLAAGLDFAFVEGRFYAGDVPNRPHPRADVTLPSWAGSPLATSAPLAAFLRQTERLLGAIAARDPRARFLAITHRGARVRGMIPVDPAGLLPVLEPVPRDAEGLLPLAPAGPPEVPPGALGDARERLLGMARAALEDPAGPVAGLLVSPAPDPALEVVLGGAFLRARETGRDVRELAEEALAGFAGLADQLSSARRTTSR